MGAPPERRYVPHLVTALGVLVTANALGSAFAPMLLVRAPLVLIALSPLGRHLVLVAGDAPMPAFVAIASANRLLSFAVVYFLARAYGENAFAWVERRYARLGRLTRTFERAFRRAAPVVIVLLPGMSAPLAGATGMPPRAYFPLAVVAAVGWVVVAYMVGDALSAWTAPVLAYVREHIASTTAVCVAAVLLYEWRRRVKLRESAR